MADIPPTSSDQLAVGAGGSQQMKLPFHVLCYAMTFMRPPALQRFARTNRAFREEYRVARHRLYNLMGMLSYYFPNPMDFRILQSRTGLLISGSFALQFMGRLAFGLTDLDLYVSQFAAFVVIDWLLNNGYRFAVHHAPNLGLADSFIYPRLRALAVHSALYLGMGQVVFKFTNDLGRNIDLIVHESSAFAAIVLFHSTAVLNLISTDWAVSLVPWGTFYECASLMLRPMTPRLLDIKQKYESRGFTVYENASGSSLFRDGERWIHDAFPSALLSLARGEAMQAEVSRHAPWMFRLPPVPAAAPGSFFFTRTYPLLPYRSLTRREDTLYWARMGFQFVTTQTGTVIHTASLFYDAEETYTIPRGFFSFSFKTPGWMGDVPDGERLDAWIQLYRLSQLPFFRQVQ